MELGKSSKRLFYSVVLVLSSFTLLFSFYNYQKATWSYDLMRTHQNVSQERLDQVKDEVTQATSMMAVLQKTTTDNSSTRSIGKRCAEDEHNTEQHKQRTSPRYGINPYRMFEELYPKMPPILFEPTPGYYPGGFPFQFPRARIPLNDTLGNDTDCSRLKWKGPKMFFKYPKVPKYPVNCTHPLSWTKRMRNPKVRTRKPKQTSPPPTPSVW